MRGVNHFKTTLASFATYQCRSLSSEGASCCGPQAFFTMIQLSGLQFSLTAGRADTDCIVGTCRHSRSS